MSLVTAAAIEAPGIDEIVRVDTAAEMERAVLERAASADVIVMAAAVADFRPKMASGQKLHKSDGVPDIVLEPTPDILAEVSRRRRDGQVLVGFAAETEDALERAAQKLRSKGVDLMVCNDVSAPGAGFDHETNSVTILDARGRPNEVVTGPKSTVAHAVLDTVNEIRAGLRGSDRHSTRPDPGRDA